MRTPRHPQSQPRHGGDLAFASRLHPGFTGAWLDLSTGINPLPYPVAPFPPSAFTRLPDPTALEGLIAAARAAYRVPPGAAILAVPGTEIALRALPALAPPGEIAILSPSYRGHGEAWREAGFSPLGFYDPAEIPPGTSVAVLCNPNNPDGRAFAPIELAELATRLEEQNGFLAVDEAYGDLSPELSLAPMTNRLPVVVLRSFGKFFGLPGLRLGFAIAPPAIAERLAARFGDWPVSGPALVIGQAALADKGWIESTRDRLGQAWALLAEMLRRHRLNVIGNATLFGLVEDERAAAIHIALAERGIWTRIFDEQPHWIRIGLASGKDLARLDTALSDVLAELDR